MKKRILFVAVLISVFSLCGTAVLQAGPICFPSQITNGSFEFWEVSKPVGWQKHGPVDTYQTEPFLGRYAVELINVSVWNGYLYQDIPYHGGSLLFGCAHWSQWNSGDRIAVVYFDSDMQEISRQSWLSWPGDWQIILTTLRPPDGTATLRIELIPQLDGIGELIVDHVFMVPIGER